MSEFFRALEQAERDRALGPHALLPDLPPSEATEVAPEEAIVEVPTVVPSAVFRRPSAKRTTPAEVPPTADEGSEGIDGHMVSLVTPTTFEAEQYRTLRHMIERRRTCDQVSIIACTSPTGGDGKTITAINLAGALAQSNETTVLLVDADLRRPSVARELTLGHDEGPGLVGAILDPALVLADVVRRRPPFTLSILPAGTPVANPYELLNSPRFGALLEEARRHYDYVVLDTPPVVSIPDCRAIAPCVDGFLVVVSAHRTPRKLVEEALSAMEPAKVIGLIFNRDDRPLGGYYSYSYGYATSSNGHRGGRWRQAVERVRALLPRGRRRGRRIR